MEYNELNMYFFPRGEIRGNPSNGFSVTPNEITPDEGIISVLCLAMQELERKNFKLAYQILIESNEPKEILVKDRKIQSVEQSVYALFICFQILKE